MRSSFISLALLFVLPLVLMQAQSSTSQINGTVSDSSNAVVAGATVTAINNATGATIRQTTTGAGIYAFSSLPVGEYTMTAEAAGFKVSKQNSVSLRIETVSTVNFTLEIGQATETVSVEATPPSIDTSNAKLGSVVTQKAIERLPLNGRNPLNLITLQPGVVQTSSGGNVNVNGSRAAATNVTIDGIDANESTNPSITNNIYRLSPDNVQEFKVTTSNPTAEEGRNSGANVSIATRSGGNQFHGTFYEFFRNTNLNARDFFTNANATPKQEVKLNQYGVEASGPIVRNKTFFFGSYEGQYVNVALPITQSFGTVSVYGAQAQAGLFRYWKPNASAPFTINGTRINANSPLLVNAQTGALAPGVRTCSSASDSNCVASYNIPANDPQRIGLDPAISAQLGGYPLPNNYSTGDGLNYGSYFWNSPAQTRGPHYMGRVDHIFNENNRIFGRYLYAQQSTLNGDPLNSRPQVLPGQPPLGEVFRPSHNFALSYNHVFSPSVVNELTLGFSRFLFTFTQGEANPAFPNIPAYSYNLVSTPFNNTPRTERAVTTPQIVDNLSVVKSSHVMAFGFNIRTYEHNDRRGQPGGFNLTPTISLSAVNRPPSGFTLPSVSAGAINSNDLTNLQSTINNLLGIPATLSQRYIGDLTTNGYIPFISGNSISYYAEGQRLKQYDFYGQDQWKVRPDLTINYGLRWEINPAPTEAAGRVYVPNLPIDGSQGLVTFVKSDRWFKNNNLGAFAPRIGIAWSPGGNTKTVIRTGYGISFDTISSFQTTSVASSVPGLVGSCSDTLGTTVSVSPGCVTVPNIRIGQGFPQSLPSPTLQPSSFLTAPVQLRTNAPATVVFDQNMKLPTVHEWNFTIERQFSNDFVASIGYVGRRGTRLFRGYDINQIDAAPILPSFNSMQNNVAAGCNPDGIGCAAGTSVPLVTSGVLTSAFVNSATTRTDLIQNAAGNFAGRIENTTLAAHLRPNQQFSTITYLDSGGDSYYHSLQATLQKHFATGLLFGATYTWGKSMDDLSSDPVGASSGGGLSTTGTSTPVNIRNFRNLRARSDFDRRHVVTVNTIYELPFGAGKRFFPSAPKLVNAIIGNWTVNGLATAQTGEPFNLLSGALTANASHQSYVALSGATAPTPSLQSKAGVIGPVLFPDTTGFALPAPGSDGIGRNSFQGPAYWDIDLSVTKGFNITERWHLVFRAEAFNALNHTNFTVGSATSSLNFLSPSFGQSLNTVGTAATRNVIQTGEPGRVVQLALKLYF